LQVAKQANGGVHKEVTVQVVVTEVKKMHCVGQSRNILHCEGKSAKELVKTQIDTLHIPEGREDVPNFGPESVGMQIENSELLKVGEATGEATLELVVGQIEVIETPKVVDPRGNGAVELVLRKIQMLQRGERPQGGRQPSGEVVAGEREVSEHPEVEESVELELTAEAEAVEDDSGDVAGLLVANNALPGSRTGGGGLGHRRRRPGV